MQSNQSKALLQKQKRARSQLSCTQCRKGKLKCDRSRPCDQCEKRDRPDACIYPPPATRSKEGNNVKGRIRHLEQLVVDLMNAKAPPGNQAENVSSVLDRDLPLEHGQTNGTQVANQQYTPPDSEGEYISSEGNPTLQPADDTATNTFGRLEISGNHTNYVGSAHWASILDSISDLKQDLGDEDDDELELDEVDHDNKVTDGISDTPNAHTLLRSPNRLSKAEILEALPPRVVVDQLVSRWFNSSDPFKPLIHKIQFDDEYRQFWNDPSETPVMWLGLLYAIMCQSCFLRLQTVKDFASPGAYSLCVETDAYHNLSASCCVLADYTSPKPYTIETLLLYAGVWRTMAAASDIWLLMGVTTRLALKAGFHRDPSHYGNVFSPYAGEMRRRTYAVLYMVDILTSFQMGLPAMLRTVQSDTQPPRNLLDQDFSIDSKVLPPSRSVEDYTPSGYGNAKVALCRVFSDAVELSHATTPPSYEAVMAADQSLEEARSATPPPLRAKAYDTNLYDTAEVYMCCIQLDILYQKSKCVLHRRFMVSTSSEPLQPYSRRSCVESAMQILRHHDTMVQASKPGGRMEVVGYYINNSAKTDFLLAATILCMELSHNAQPCSPGPGLQDVAIVARDEMIDMLERTKTIWEEAVARMSHSLVASGPTRHHLLYRSRNSTVRDTMKACKAITIMLRIARSRGAGRTKTSPGTDQGVLQRAQNEWSFDPATMSNYPANLEAKQRNGIEEAGLGGYAVIDNLMNGMDNIDWAPWDQQLGGLSIPDDFQSWNVDDMMGASITQTNTVAQSFDFAGFGSNEPFLPS